MVRRVMLECAFLIPSRRNKNLSNGRMHLATAWAWLHNELFAFGGATRAIELYIGWYIDSETGERVKDLSRRYFVALPKKETGRLRSLLRKACRVFQQKSIYLSVAGRVEFIEGPWQ